MLSKAASSTIFWVLGITRPEIGPRSPGPLANTLFIRSMARLRVMIMKGYLTLPRTGAITCSLVLLLGFTRKWKGVTVFVWLSFSKNNLCSTLWESNSLWFASLASKPLYTTWGTWLISISYRVLTSLFVLECFLKGLITFYCALSRLVKQNFSSDLLLEDIETENTSLSNFYFSNKVLEKYMIQWHYAYYSIVIVAGSISQDCLSSNSLCYIHLWGSIIKQWRYN